MSHWHHPIQPKGNYFIKQMLTLIKYGVTTWDPFCVLLQCLNELSKLWRGTSPLHIGHKCQYLLLTWWYQDFWEISLLGTPALPLHAENSTIRCQGQRLMSPRLLEAQDTGVWSINKSKQSYWQLNNNATVVNWYLIQSHWRGQHRGSLG